MKKKVLTTILSLVLMVTMMPLSAFAGTSSTMGSKVISGERENALQTEKDYFSFTAKNGCAKIQLEGKVSLDNLEYSMDKTSWDDFVFGNAKNSGVQLSKDQTVYLRLKEGAEPKFPGQEGNKNDQFVITADSGAYVDAGGNIMSLVSTDCSALKMEECGFALLFRDCHALRKAPELPATELAEACYSGIFSGCTGLEEAPRALPAETLPKYAYSSMFYGCSKLKKSPAIAATKLGYQSCLSMFIDCKSLESITVNFNDWNENEFATRSWVMRIGNHGGTFYSCGKKLQINRGNDYVPEGWNIAAHYINFEIEHGKVFSKVGHDETTIPRIGDKVVLSTTMNKGWHCEGYAIRVGEEVYELEGNTFAMPGEDVTVIVREDRNVHDIDFGTFMHVSPSASVNGAIVENAKFGDTVKLKSEVLDDGWEVTSWTVNGKLIQGDTFVMPDEDVTISGIVSKTL